MNFPIPLILLCCLLPLACAHTAIQKEEYRTSLLALGALHPLSTKSVLHPEDLPGNDRMARAALFHMSDASPATFAWRVLHRIPDFERHPHYGELLARMFFCMEDLDAMMHVADTRIQHTRTRFRLYHMAYGHLQSLGKEEQARRILRRLEKSFSRQERKSPEVQMQWMVFHILENNYPEAKAPFRFLASLPPESLPPEAFEVTFFYHLRKFARMALAAHDRTTAEGSAALLARLMEAMPPAPARDPEEGESLEHTYILGRDGKIQKGTGKTIARIALLRLYEETGDKDGVLRVYRQLQEAWKQALTGNLSGKSFENWLPAIAETLYRAGFREEALGVSAWLPSPLPFVVHSEPGMSAEDLAISRAQQRRYNLRRPAQIQKNLAFRLIRLMAEKESEETLLAFIQAFPDRAHRPNLLIRALQVRVGGGLQAPLLWTRYLDGEDGPPPDLRSREIRLLLRSLLIGRETGRAFEIMEKERADAILFPWKHTAPGQLGDMAAAFADFFPETAEKLLQEALDLFDAIGYSPEEGAAVIDDLVVTGRKMPSSQLRLRLLEVHARTHRRLMQSQERLLTSDRDQEEKFFLLSRIVRARLRLDIRDGETHRLLGEMRTTADAVTHPMLKKHLRVRTAAFQVQAGAFREAWEMLENLDLEENPDIHTLLGIRKDVLLYDAFPDNPPVRFDMDADGLPDFFSPLAEVRAILESGLSLDPDTDGDGMPDTEDLRPWFPDGPENPASPAE